MMITIIAVVFSAILGAAILSHYNKAGYGFMLGGLLSVFGLAIALIMRSDEIRKEEAQWHDEMMAALGSKKAHAKRATSGHDTPQKKAFDGTPIYEIK